MCTTENEAGTNMPAHACLLGVTNDVQLDWDSLPPTRQQHLLDFLEWYGWESKTELPVTFKQLMGAFEECKLADSVLPPLDDQLAAFLPAIPERTCAMFNVAQGIPCAIIFDPDASKCLTMVGHELWQGVHSQTCFRLAAGERERDLQDEAGASFHRVYRSGLFHDHVLEPMQNWPPFMENPEKYLTNFHFHPRTTDDTLLPAPSAWWLV